MVDLSLCALELYTETRISINLFFFLFFLHSHLWHMEVPRPGVEFELQLSVYTTATSMPDLRCLSKFTIVC